jgi:DNA repair exonuclease SbcCD ATPase subunit
VTRAEKRHRAAVKARAVTQEFVRAVQDRVYGKVSSLVTRCLQAVFDDPYTFRIIVDKKRGKAEARLVFVRDDEEFDPVEECGGGVLDVAAFALRLATVQNILFLDEPFKHVSREYVPKLSALLDTLSRTMGIQFFIVTHNPDLVCGKVVRI